MTNISTMNRTKAMLNNPCNILVDSDAFFALSNSNDANHKKAKIILEELLLEPVVFQLSNYTFAETVSVLSRKVGRDAALTFIHRVKNDDAPLQFYWVDEEVETLAIEFFQNQTSKNVSFFDCVNMAIMKMENNDAIFSFDAIYRKNGFQTVEEILKK